LGRELLQARGKNEQQEEGLLWHNVLFITYINYINIVHFTSKKNAPWAKFSRVGGT